MRASLKAALQARWEGSLRDRAQLCPRSIVPTLDTLLAPYRQPPAKIRSPRSAPNSLPKSDIVGVGGIRKVSGYSR